MERGCGGENTEKREMRMWLERNVGSRKVLAFWVSGRLGAWVLLFTQKLFLIHHNVF